MTKDVGELGDVLLQTIKNPCEQVAKVMREHLAGTYSGILAERFHLPPDCCPIQRLTILTYKHGLRVDFLLLDIEEQLFLQLFYKKHDTSFALA